MAVTYKTVLSARVKARLKELDDEHRKEVRRAIDTLVRDLVEGEKPGTKIVQKVSLLPSGGYVIASVNDPTKTIYVEYAEALGEKVFGRFSREEALRIVAAGIGARPDLPSGTEYVNGIRHIWSSLWKNQRAP
jgi:mRNA-degrading endonuclease RelE of RelBE toxin-antitoxin system